MANKSAKTVDGQNKWKKDFTLPLFVPAVAEAVNSLQKEMPVWFGDYEYAVCIRALTGEEHHPNLWCLAGLMIRFAVQEREGAQSTMNFYGTPSYWIGEYPMLPEDCETVGIWKQGWQAKGAKFAMRNLILFPCVGGEDVGAGFDFSGIWRRCRDRVRQDVNKLVQAAIIAGDNTFFKCWGEACSSVAAYSFGAQEVIARRNWCNGQWIGDVRWQDVPHAKPQARSRFLIDLCTARLSFRCARGRIPTDTETAQVLIQMQQAKGSLPKAFTADPKGYQKRLAASIRTVCKRNGFSRVTITKGRPISADKSL